MEKDIETIIVEFNNVAARIYSATFNQFLDSIRRFDRKENENVFRLQSAKYADMLKQRLQGEFTKVLDANDSFEFSEQLKFALTLRVNYYLQEFRHRSNAL